MRKSYWSHGLIKSNAFSTRPFFKAVSKLEVGEVAYVCSLEIGTGILPLLKELV